MVRNLVWLSLLGVGIYIGVHYAAPQFRAWRFRDAMNQSAKLAGSEPDEELRGSLMETARELHVPLAPKRLIVRRDHTGRLYIGATWQEIVRLRAWKLGEWVDTLHYDHEAEQQTGREASR